jgi:hypothetical protein
MYRTMYSKTTGKIEICRTMSDSILAQMLASNTDLAYLDGYTGNISEKKVDLDTLTVVDDPTPFDFDAYLILYRNNALLSSDWTQAIDSPLSDSKKAEWQTYRQALRDLPATHPEFTDINDLVMPTKPE